MNNIDFIFNEDFIKNKLKSFNSINRLSLVDENFVKSAVIFLIIPYNNKPYDLVLIRRTSRKGDKHSGEMAFPGGKFDERFDKTYQDTAKWLRPVFGLILRTFMMRSVTDGKISD